jgi:hypothetical protein
MSQKTPVQVKSEFRKKCRVQLLMGIVLAPPVIVGFHAYHDHLEEIAGISIEILGPLLLLAVLVAFGVSFWNWRCPACDGYLGHALFPKTCRRCGVELRD